MNDDQEPAQVNEQEQEQDEAAPKRSMRDRLFKAAPAEPAADDAPNDAPVDEPGADAEADQRAIEDEFWNKK